MSKETNWQEFSDQLLRYSEPDLWIDLSQMRMPKDIINTEKESIERALHELSNIESGEKVNTDEDIAAVTPIVMRILDNVIDLNYYPIKEAELTAKKYRSV